ncbi:hypothetical protein BH24ACT13_BH24ACT13_13620 [soil metagenome]
MSLFSGIHYDFDPKTPAELSALSDLIVVGRIVDIQQGRTFEIPGEEGSSFDSLLLRLRVQQVISPAAKTAPGDDVFVELPTSGGISASTYDAAAPKQATVLVYLVDLVSPGPKDDPQLVAVSEAWRQAGTVMEPTNPQSFIIGSDERILEVLSHGVSDSSSLEAYLPPGARLQ